MALTVGSYVAPEHVRLVAVLAVVALTALGWAGVQRSTQLSAVIVVVSLAALLVVVLASCRGGTADAANLHPFPGSDARGHPAVSRAAVLRLRRLRAHRHPRRGGPRPRPDDPPRDHHRAARGPGGLRGRRPERAARDRRRTGSRRRPHPCRRSSRPGRGPHGRPRSGSAPPPRHSAPCWRSCSACRGRSWPWRAIDRRSSALARLDERSRTPRTAEVAVGARGRRPRLDARPARRDRLLVVRRARLLRDRERVGPDVAPRRGTPASRSIPVVGLVGCLVLACTLPLGAVLAGLGVVILATLEWAVRRRRAA